MAKFAALPNIATGYIKKHHKESTKNHLFCHGYYKRN